MLNTANILTLSRIVAIPLVVACFWLDRGWSQWLSMILFVLAAVTDWFGGYFSPRYHQISRLGRFLDPIADKLLGAAAPPILGHKGGPLRGVLVFGSLILRARGGGPRKRCGPRPMCAPWVSWSPGCEIAAAATPRRWPRAPRSARQSTSAR